jgi:hypothetical protein
MVGSVSSRFGKSGHQTGHLRDILELGALDDHFGGDRKDKVEVFMANRGEIEELARRKYLAGKTEGDGSVLIRTVEL